MKKSNISIIKLILKFRLLVADQQEKERKFENTCETMSDSHSRPMVFDLRISTLIHVKNRKKFKYPLIHFQESCFVRS